MIDTKALREKVLDLAIRGKLVPQDPNDEPATVLLERIRAEKEQLVKDGKLKAKDIKNDTIIFKGDDNLHYEQFPDGTVKCIEDEIPFDVPDNWAWVRLQTVCQKEIKRGKAPKYAEKSGTLVFAQKCNTKNGLINISLAQYLDETNLHKYPIELFTQYGDIIINSTGTGTLGRVGIFEQKDDIEHLPIIPDSHITTVRVFPNIVKKYMYLFLKTHQPFFESSGEGSTNQKELRPDVIKSFIVAIPPFNEQKRIVEKFEMTSEIINQLDAYTDNIKDTIAAAKNKILDLAIRGKLVSQNPDDEPAAVLLERIRAEKEELIKQGKIKRDKKESVIFKGEDNSYYDILIPDNWVWTSLIDVSLSISDGSHNPPPKRTSGIPLLSAMNIFDNKINYNSATRWITEEEWTTENTRTKIEVGDVLITIVGTIGRTAVVDDTTHFALQRSVAVIKPIGIISKYLMYMLQAPMIMAWLNKNAKGNAQVGIYLKDLAGLSFPLPPLVEQKRIVEAIEVSFAQLDEIINSIS